MRREAYGFQPILVMTWNKAEVNG